MTDFLQLTTTSKQAYPIKTNNEMEKLNNYEIIWNEMRMINDMKCGW
jgi:hypothetical protein